MTTQLYIRSGTPSFCQTIPTLRLEADLNNPPRQRVAEAIFRLRVEATTDRPLYGLTCTRRKRKSTPWAPDQNAVLARLGSFVCGTVRLVQAN